MSRLLFALIFGAMMFLSDGLYAQKQSAISWLRQKITGVYIPVDLNDCIVQLDSMLADTTKAAIPNMSELEFHRNTHFGLGLWMRNTWELWGGSRLSRYFNSLGIQHADDMSGIILTSYYRYLGKKDIDLDGQVQYYQNYWRVMRVPTRKEHPKEAKKLKLLKSVGYKDKNGSVQMIHVHVNKAGEIWFYSSSFGWTKTTDKNLQQLTEENADREQLLKQIYKL